MELVTSEKRKNKIIHEGFIYVLQKNLSNNIRSFECERRRYGECKAKIKVNIQNEILGRLHEHTHNPSATNIEINKVSSTTYF